MIDLPSFRSGALSWAAPARRDAALPRRLSRSAGDGDGLLVRKGHRLPVTWGPIATIDQGLRDDLTQPPGLDTVRTREGLPAASTRGARMRGVAHERDDEKTAS